MKSNRMSLLIGAVFLTACANQRQSYVAQHPELSPAHRQIMATGKVPGGEAIAGMTREQVTTALGAAASFDKVNGEDTWTYVRRKTAEMKKIEANMDAATPGSGFNKPLSPTDPNAFGDNPNGNEYTTIYFRGDLATHARVSDEKP